MARTPQVVVAGHICLDIIPAFERGTAFEAGKLVNVGPAVLSTGGVVSNTGLALHRLGVPTRLMGKVGNDFFGRAILELLRKTAPSLAEGMIVAPGEPSSYTVVISPPATDRMFLHCPGVNDTFRAQDVNYDQLAGARLFHFGYPPLMRCFYRDEGRQLAELFRRVKARGLTTSLDMTMPDPQSEAGRVNWPALLRRVLPYVDIFLPSLDEFRFMLRRPKDRLSHLANPLLAWGAGIVGLKLGDQGLYLRTAQRELLAPCFEVKVVGTTGSGDCTIAGFLAAHLRGLPLEQALTMAVAVGACGCEAADATSGVPSWAKVKRRILRGWKRRRVTLSLPGWHWEPGRQLWIGPHDEATKSERD